MRNPEGRLTRNTPELAQPEAPPLAVVTTLRSAASVRGEWAAWLRDAQPKLERPFGIIENRDHAALLERARPDSVEWRHWLVHGVQGADAARYAWLQLRGERGGMYLDADLRGVQRLAAAVEHALRGADAVVARGPNVGGVSNCLLASRGAKGAELWAICLDEIARNPRPRGLGRHADVLLSTGPGMLGRAVRRFRRAGGVVRVLPAHGSGGRPAVCGDPAPRDALVRQLPGGSSWGGFDTLLLNSMACGGAAAVLAAVFCALSAGVLAAALLLASSRPRSRASSRACSKPAAAEATWMTSRPRFMEPRPGCFKRPLLW